MTILYLHGFASGPRSTKGVAFAEHFARLGIAIERLDLRVPSFEHLRLSAMIETTRAAIRGPTIAIGSSLGGLTAARVAALDDRITALVLMAPAFQLAARWRERLGRDLDTWRDTGWLEVDDYATGGRSRVDFGFFEELQRVDAGWPDVRVPTLVFHGTRDDVVPIANSRAFAATRPHVRVRELDDGHELAASLPTLLAESEQFLATYYGK
ncbi:MAG TPA: YqiA/YcfP family alpha/beta fold hydrolase [Kofleriaceae bacterium]|nr:YqiA/YcfP family alpha/beta fold hydrolase [Kofleriaceae bacterium]